jgi:sigma-B regulation protein RsbU (phosphoserine phosphatase)
MRLRALVLSFGYCLIACSALGQAVDFDSSRVPIAELVGPWRFHTGDDPSWANPSFDDSGWTLMRTDKGWSGQGFAGYGGVAWYRLAIAIPAQHRGLALYIPSVDVSCQVFANGRLIGQVGDLPPHPHWVSQERMLFAIPTDLAASDRLQLAIRVWEPTSYGRTLAGGLYPAPRIGDASALAEWRRLEGRELYWQNSFTMVELFANVIGGLASLIMFSLLRKEREYLWFGACLLNFSVYQATVLYSVFHPVPNYAIQVFLYGAVLGIGYFATAEFYAALWRQPRRWIYGIAIFFVIAGPVVGVVTIFDPQTLWKYGWAWGLAGFWACMMAMLFRAWKAGDRDAAIPMVPLLMQSLGFLLIALANTPPIGHQAWAQAFLHFWYDGMRWPFPIWGTYITGDLTNVAALIVLIRRFARSRRDEERLVSELEAARIVQKVLIPDEVPAISGFEAQAVYKPASQVGGDFFQIVAAKNGGALVVIGDVSGKGMPAAMTVSLLVGTFRTLAHYTQSPAEILRAMNQRMLARSGGGFTTCSVLRADADGNVTVANAGHLAPYLDGKELPLESGLPLGLSADSSYIESRFPLRPGDRLTLLTDGVPEARNARGELFGFESTAAISTESADTIAEAARIFGQEDDVTVVQLTLDPLRIHKSPAFAIPAAPVLS